MKDLRLIDAVDKNDLAQVKALLASGLAVDTRGSHGETALMRAAAYGDPRMVDFLLSKGARLTTTTLWGGFPLNYAAGAGHLPIVRLLVAHGADINAVDRLGETALMDAAEFGRTNVTAFLIEKGANINARDRGPHMTALIRAVNRRRYECVKLLMAHGADKSLRDRDGETAVTYARKNRDTRALKLLDE